MAVVNSTGKNLTILISTDYSVIGEWMSFACFYSIIKNLPDAKIVVLCSRNSNYFSTVTLYQWAYKLRLKFFQFKGVKGDSPYLNKLYAIFVGLRQQLFDGSVLVVSSDMMFVRELSAETLQVINDPKVRFGTSTPVGGFGSEKVGPVWYFRDPKLEDISRALSEVKGLYTQLGDNGVLDLMGLQSAFAGEIKRIDDLCADVTTDNIVVVSHIKDRCGRFSKKDGELKSGIGHWSFAIMPYYKDFKVSSLNERRVFDLWAAMTDTFSVLNTG